jgi:hypothetical protein
VSIADLFRRRRGAEAALLDPTLLEAFASAKERAQLAIERSSLKDHEVRELAYHRLKALEAVKHELERFIAAHKIERERLDKATSHDAGGI